MEVTWLRRVGIDYSVKATIHSSRVAWRSHEAVVFSKLFIIFNKLNDIRVLGKRMVQPYKGIVQYVH